MENLVKALKIIINSFNVLGKKIDSLTSEVKKQKVPIVNVKAPEVNVNVPDFPAYPDFPEIKLPTIEVTVPEIKLPTINVPKQEAPIVNVPPANITVTPTPVTFPSEMKVEGMDKLIAEVSRETEDKSIFNEVNSKTPLPIIVMGKNGKQITDFGGEFSAPNIVSLKVGITAVSSDNLLPVTTDGFSIPVFDQQVIDESAAPATTTITYKRAGATVATKTIVISGTTTTISVTIS